MTLSQTNVSALTEFTQDTLGIIVSCYSPFFSQSTAPANLTEFVKNTPVFSDLFAVAGLSILLVMEVTLQNQGMILPTFLLFLQYKIIRFKVIPG